MSRFVTLCVNYRSDAETAEFVRTVGALPGYDGHIVVVSNSALEEHGPLAAISAADPVSVVLPERNLGYFSGAAWGLDRYLKTNPLPEWVIVSNTDISFPDRELFVKLENLYKSDPPAVVAPDIVLQPGTKLPGSRRHQNPHMLTRPSVIRMRVLRSLARFYIVFAMYEFASALRYCVHNAYRQGSGRSMLDYPTSIYAPHGAFIIFHRSYFEAGGSLRYPSFLYSEEIYVAETARSLGLRVTYEPRLRVAHHEHGSIRTMASRRRAHCARQSYNYVVKTYF